MCGLRNVEKEAEMIANVLSGACLLTCTVTDIRKRVIYPILLLPFFIAGIMWQFMSRSRGVMDIAGGVFTGIVLLITSHLTKGKIGAGDGLIFIVTGVLLGTLENIRLLTMASVLSAVCSIVLLITRRCGRDTELPFAPFILAAFIIGIVL